jgi:hypothetical protein
MRFSAGCSLLRAEGFSCSLDVLHGGIGKSKWQFLIKKMRMKKLFMELHFSVLCIREGKK